MMKQRGVTLIELLYTLGVAAILLGIGVPSFVDQLRSSRMHASTQSLLGGLYVARSEAVKQRARVTLCRSTVEAAPTCAGDGDGYAVFVNMDDDASFDPGAGDTLVRNDLWLRPGLSVLNDGLTDYVTYVSSGFTREIGGGTLAGDLVFCDARGNDAARVLRLPATGRPQVVAHSEVAGAPSCPTT